MSWCADLDFWVTPELAVKWAQRLKLLKRRLGGDDVAGAVPGATVGSWLLGQLLTLRKWGLAAALAKNDEALELGETLPLPCVVHCLRGQDVPFLTVLRDSGGRHGAWAPPSRAAGGGGGRCRPAGASSPAFNFVVVVVIVVCRCRRLSLSPSSLSSSPPVREQVLALERAFDSEHSELILRISLANLPDHAGACGIPGAALRTGHQDYQPPVSPQLARVLPAFCPLLPALLSSAAPCAQCVAVLCMCMPMLQHDDR